MNKSIIVGSYQGPLIEENYEQALLKLRGIILEAKRRCIDIICLPESFLHGYFDNKESASKHSIKSDKDLDQLKEITQGIEVIVIVGGNELEQTKLFNTAFVLQDGKLLGRYRKAYSYPPYDYYSLGREFPVFEVKGIKFGIIICYDSAFFEPARITALNGARLLFCPMYNKIPRDSRMLYYLNLKSHFTARAFENDCWLVSSDIIFDSESHTCPGYSGIFNQLGQQVVSPPPFQEVLISYEIPYAELEVRRDKKVVGNSELFEILLDKQRKKHKESDYYGKFNH